MDQRMTDKKIIQIDEHLIQDKITEVVKESIEITLNEMLNAESDRLCNADRYEHTEGKERHQSWLLHERI